MTTAQDGTPTRPGHGSWMPRRWALWRERPIARVYVVGASVLALVLGIVYAFRTPWNPQDLVPFAVLLACAAVCVEGTRRLGEVVGQARDLLFAWGLPVALLLPPVYAFFFPLLAFTLEHLSGRRGLLYRAVFSASARVLGLMLASILIHLRLPGSAGTRIDPWLSEPEVLLPLAIGCGILCTVVNALLVAFAMRISEPETSWRQALWDWESFRIDAVELCVGVLVAVAAAFSLGLMALALPPVLMLQRSLVHDQLRLAARTDAKTGLLNAATWQREAEREVSRATRNAESLALLLVDLDHFKRVNDQHGHLLGDQVLAEVATVMGGQLRDYDLLGRFGGEEFVVLLPETDTAEAYRVAQRLRVRVGRTAVPLDEATLGVTISIGIALLGGHGKNLVELLAAADLALYHAKASGRDRVCLPAGGQPGERTSAPPGDGRATDGAALDSMQDPFAGHHADPRRAAGKGRAPRRPG